MRRSRYSRLARQERHGRNRRVVARNERGDVRAQRRAGRPTARRRPRAGPTGTPARPRRRARGRRGRRLAAPRRARPRRCGGSRSPAPRSRVGQSRRHASQSCSVRDIIGSSSTAGAGVLSGRCSAPVTVHAVPRREGHRLRLGGRPRACARPRTRSEISAAQTPVDPPESRMPSRIPPSSLQQRHHLAHGAVEPDQRRPRDDAVADVQFDDVRHARRWAAH